MRILVTGGVGWTAEGIVAELERAGHRAVLFDLPPSVETRLSEELRTGREVHTGDIVDYRTVRSLVDNVEGIVHLAVATGEAAYNDPRIPFSVNVEGTYNLFEAARISGISRVVIMSSAPVHIDDRSAFSGTWHSSTGDDHLYDLTKRLQEEVARDFCDTYGMTVIALRAGHVVDGRVGVDPKNRPLEKLTYCKGGWICRYDLARACRFALQAEVRGFVALPVVGSRRGYERFGVAETERLLGFSIECDFASYEN